MLRKELLQQVANEFNIKESEVELIYKLWWKKVREVIDSYDFSNLPEDSCTDINIPNIGKLIVNKKVIEKLHGSNS